MSAITSQLADTRTSDSWPLHKAKARNRKATRKRIARESQQANDRAASKKL